MESWIIILGVIIVIIAYFLIKYYFFSVQYSVSKKYLKTDSGKPITLGTDPETRSINYSFGSWIYVNNFSDTIIYSYNQGAANPPVFALILGGVIKSSLEGTGADGNIGSAGTPVLTAYINGATSTGGTNRIPNTVTITNNFPIQKWVHVLVSVDTTYVDCYIDGKLIISKPLTNQITSEIGSATDESKIGFYLSDIWLTQLNRWNKPLDPQSVWNEYYKGNGLSQMGDIELIFNVKYNP
jgi:hypothetical protein